VGRAASAQRDILAAYDSYHFHPIYQKLHNFCVTDMGSFYLNIIKDRQYTCQENSRARRSAQSAIYHIAEALVRWIAPVLSFTADEIWHVMPGERGESVFMAEWWSLPSAAADAIPDSDWALIARARNTVNKVLEGKKEAGIQKSLEAEVVLHADGELAGALGKLKDELRFVLITSDARLAPLSEADGAESTELEGLLLSVARTSYAKCVRCWHHRADVGAVAEHPELCGRCVENVTGVGERRLFA
jgi:isoleucyl-tRNA synthetase